MKTTIKIYAISSILLTSTFGFVQGQSSARIDQFFLDHTVVNPAAVSLQKTASVNLFYNRTFAGVPGGPENVVANVVLPLKDKRTGFGLFYLREKAGFQQLHNAYITYAYSFPLADEVNLSLGASLGVLSQNFDATKAVYITAGDPVIQNLMHTPSATRADLRASAYLDAKGFIAGFGFSRMAKPRFDYSYYNYKASYSLQNLGSFLIGYKIVASENVSIKPMLLFNSFNFDYFSFNGNVSVYYKDKVWGGIGTDASNQLAFNLGMKLQETVSIGYSYTTLLGTTKGILGPMHEVFLGIALGALRGGKSTGSDEEDSSSDSDNSSSSAEEESSSTPAKRRYVETNVSSIDELKAAGSDLDTAGIKMPVVDVKATEPGIYLVVGLYSSEARANQRIKELYMQGIFAYKFYDPVNHSYYVWVKKFKTHGDATKYLLNADSNLPQSWIREVK